MGGPKWSIGSCEEAKNVMKFSCFCNICTFLALKNISDRLQTFFRLVLNVEYLNKLLQILRGWSRAHWSGPKWCLRLLCIYDLFYPNLWNLSEFLEQVLDFSCSRADFGPKKCSNQKMFGDLFGPKWCIDYVWHQFRPFKCDLGRFENVYVHK